MSNYGRDNRGGGRPFGGRNSGPRRFDRDSRGGGRDDRQMHQAVCDNCGKNCEVPFKPTQGKPVYCSDCFGKMNDRGDSSRTQRDSYRPSVSGQASLNLDQVNAKLDKILALLEPKAAETIAVEEFVAEQKEEKTPKVKKSPAKKKATV